MSRIFTFLFLSLIVTRAFAAWYWPFASDDEKKPPRMSELLEKSSILIDEAFDLAAQNKVSEAVEKYKEAYAELERLELENPERAATSEFSTVRNKKAYVSTSIDSLLLKQASDNARAVAVTDTAEIERKYAEEQMALLRKSNKDKTGNNDGLQNDKVEEGRALGRNAASETAVLEAKGDNTASQEVSSVRKKKLLYVVKSLNAKNYAAAEAIINNLLKENPKDVTALNLKAALFAATKDYQKAKLTLRDLIQVDPGDYAGYYNLAKLIVQFEGVAGKPEARRYYESARKHCGGPKDEKLEEMLK